MGGEDVGYHLAKLGMRSLYRLLAAAMDAIDEILGIGHCRDHVEPRDHGLLEDEVELRSERLTAAAARFDPGERAFSIAADQRAEDVILVAKIVVEGLAGHAGLFAKVTHATALHAVARKHPHGGVQQCLFGFIHWRTSAFVGVSFTDEQKMSI